MEWTPDPRCCSIRLAGRCPEEAPTMSLTYRRVNPLDHPASIKRLFVEEGRPEFPAWFDRAYPVLVASGGSSWVAIDSAGTVQLHIATFPVQMRCRGTTIKAVLFSNLIASADHRNFLPAAGLLRQAVEGMKRDGRDVLATRGPPTTWISWRLQRRTWRRWLARSSPSRGRSCISAPSQSLRLGLADSPLNSSPGDAT